MSMSTPPTTSAVLRACASVARAPCVFVTLPRGSIKLELLLPRQVFAESVLALLRLQENEVADDETVHLCSHEARESLRGRADNRLAADVETRVDEDGTARQALEGGEQLVIERVVLASNGLHARRVVNVRDRRYLRTWHVQFFDAEEF